MATAVQSKGAQAGSASSHPFTCVTCAIAFRSSELQRNHMKSDWHKYNLKRRVASLPPLSSEVFAEKVLNAQVTSSAAAAKASFEKTCQACQRTYYSENAFLNHVGSAKHKQRVIALQNSGHADTETASVMSSTISLGEPLAKDASEDIEDSEVEAEFSKVVQGLKEASINAEPGSGRPSRPHHSSNEDRPQSQASTTPTTGTAQSSQMPLPRCIFCNYDSPNLKLNIMHMTKFHSLFIPEKEYLEDLEGLIKYLQAKVVENYECICCHKLKGSMHGVQTHMRDVGHCRIGFETEEEMIEIGQFYDFRSTYSDEEDEDSSESEESEDKGVKSSARRSSGQKIEGEEEGWETDSDESVATDELTAVPIDPDYHRLGKHKHHSHSDPRTHRAADGFHSHAHQHHAAFYSDYELHMPSGRAAGHRSLGRYFRQNLHNYPSAQEREEQLLLQAAEGEDHEEGEETRPETDRGRNRQVVQRGDMGMVGVTSQKKQEVVKATKRAQQQADKAERRNTALIQRRANKQKHFRDDNFGTHV